MRGIQLKIAVYYTRPTTLSTIGTHPATDNLINLPREIALIPGRPRLERTLDDLLDRTVKREHRCGIAIGVCGPVTLVGETRQTVRGTDPLKRADVGGIELHEEYVRLLTELAHLDLTSFSGYSVDFHTIFDRGVEICIILCITSLGKRMKIKPILITQQTIDVHYTM